MISKLLIIDGNHIMHRAYHAFPPLTTPDGQPVQAVYGFFSMLIKVLEETHATHIVVCFDRAAPTFRKQLYAGYQAQRPKMTDDLSGQFVLIHEGLEKIGIPVFEVDGYEADDLIGTLALQANSLNEKGSNTKDKLEVVILSGDRDLLQLVNLYTSVLAPITGITKFILFDEKTVQEKFGIMPVQISDYKALVGDNSDGYPGVNGIGSKTAVILLQEYKTVEELYKNINLLPEKIGKKLALDAEQAMLCKKLATIVTDAPVHLDSQTADLQNFTQEKVIASFDVLGFNTIKKRTNVFPHEDPSTLKQWTGKKKLEKNENQLDLI